MVYQSRAYQGFISIPKNRNMQSFFGLRFLKDKIKPNPGLYYKGISMITYSVDLLSQKFYLGPC